MLADTIYLGLYFMQKPRKRHLHARQKVRCDEAIRERSNLKLCAFPQLFSMARILFSTFRSKGIHYLQAEQEIDKRGTRAGKLCLIESLQLLMSRKAFKFAPNKC